MNLQAFLQNLPREQLEKLAHAKDVRALADAAKGLGLALADGEAETVFAALFPVRGKELSDDLLALISGGAAPKPTAYARPFSATNQDIRL